MGCPLQPPCVGGFCAPQNSATPGGSHQKNWGLLIPRDVGQPSPAQTRPTCRGGTGGDTGEGMSSLGCDVGSTVLVTTRDPGCRDKAGNVLESSPRAGGSDRGWRWPVVPGGFSCGTLVHPWSWCPLVTGELIPEHPQLRPDVGSAVMSPTPPPSPRALSSALWVCFTGGRVGSMSRGPVLPRGLPGDWSGSETRWLRSRQGRSLCRCTGIYSWTVFDLPPRSATL